MHSRASCSHRCLLVSCSKFQCMQRECRRSSDTPLSGAVARMQGGQLVSVPRRGISCQGAVPVMLLLAAASSACACAHGARSGRLQRLRGGGRAPASMQRLRRREAKEQMALPIGKSMWRRQQSRMQNRGKAVRESMVGNLPAEMGDLKGRAEAAAANLDGGSDLFGMEQRHGAAEGVAELSKLEEDARALLQRVQSAKGAALKKQRRHKAGRKSR